MKNIINTIKENKKLIAIAVVIGLLLGLAIAGLTGKKATTKKSQQTAQVQTQQEKKTIWTCSMHPQIREDEPGKCPICGMDLIPLEQEEELEAQEVAKNPDEIQLSEEAVALAQIQTTVVRRGTPIKELYLFGKIVPDERRYAEITARFGGRIERLYVNFTGQNVKKGQKLATIYSPDLITAQKELLEAAKYKTQNPSLYQSARKKLLLWDLTPAQIDQIEKTGHVIEYFDVLAPLSGTVLKRFVAQGDYVREGSKMFQVADLSHLWVMLDAYEQDLPWIKIGDKAEFTAKALPGKTFTARVAYIDPFIDPQTRVAHVRLEVNNPGMQLKPEMFVNAKLSSTIGTNTKQLLIPKTAVLWTGKRSVVYVKVPNRQKPTFLYREVTLGPEAGDYYVVVDGLKEGEEVVTYGVFKIDASAQLQGKKSMMNPTGGKVQTGHHHGGMNMGGNDQQMDMPAQEEQEQQMDMNGQDDHSGHTGDGMTMAPEAFKQQLGQFTQVYLKMKDAFVASDPEKATQLARQALSALDKIDMELLSGEAHNQWMKLYTDIKNNLNGIIQMKGLEMKRSHFGIISDRLATAIQTFGIETSDTLYVEYCPMAFDNKGAVWVSQIKQIRNPYFGDKMLTCGEVQKVIKPGK